MEKVLYSMVFSALSFMAMVVCGFANSPKGITISGYSLLIGLVLSIAFVIRENSQKNIKTKFNFKR